MKNVIVLGSTGTLGTASLKVLKKYEKHFRVFGLVAGENGELLAGQMKGLCKTTQGASSFSEIGILSASIPNLQNAPSRPRALLASRDGQKKVLELIRLPEVDIVINLIPGLAGLPASVAALKGGKVLLVANKESLVAEGEKLMKLANPNQIVPLDSEHNAIFEILKNYAKQNNLEDTSSVCSEVQSIYLPCSGGPFLGYKKSQLQNVTVNDVLAHPVWKMGPKVTVESATLLNKGFEVIEAHHLFGLPLNKIKVFIHPQGQVHGIVQFKKGARTKRAPVIGYISRPSMSLHIENALRHVAGLSPIKGRIQILSPKKFETITALRPDHLTFPGIKVVLEAFKDSRIVPFLKKEEKLVESFLKGKLKFKELLQKLSLL